MIYTTLNRIMDHDIYKASWEKLLSGLGKNRSDDEPIGFDVLIRIVGPDDAYRALRSEPQHDRLWRMVAVRNARMVQHLLTDKRSLDALDVAERYADDRATYAELMAACYAAKSAATDAKKPASAWAAAWSVARAAVGWSAGCDVAWASAGAASGAAADDATDDAVWAPAGDASGSILLSVVSEYHADPGSLGEKLNMASKA